MKYAPILFLPSLETADELITVRNVNRAEAEAFLRTFDTLVEANHRFKHNPNACDDLLDAMNGNLGLLSFVEFNRDSLSELLDTLSKSSVPGYRGRRAVYVDPNTDLIAVGTTVVYNQNWASKGVLDPSVMHTILEFVGDEELEDEE